MLAEIPTSYMELAGQSLKHTCEAPNEQKWVIIPCIMLLFFHVPGGMDCCKTKIEVCWSVIRSVVTLRLGVSNRDLEE